MRDAKFYAVQSVDYLNVYCAEHNELCTVHYRGLDPIIPLLEIACPKCGSNMALKLNTQGGEGWHQIPESERGYLMHSGTGQKT